MLATLHTSITGRIVSEEFYGLGLIVVKILYLEVTETVEYL